MSPFLFILKSLVGPRNSLADDLTYLFITYIVTSKPKRISVAAGFVHIVISP